MEEQVTTTTNVVDNFEEREVAENVDTRNLIDKLRKKLNQLDLDHRSLCNEVQQIATKIEQERRSLRDIPKRVEKLQSIAKIMENGLRDIEYQSNNVESQIEALKSTENEGLSRTKIRKDILHEVCTDAEFQVVSDGVDVKTSEVRRRISALQEKLASLQSEYQEMMRKMSDVRSMLKPESLQQATTEINQRVNALEKERYDKNVECKNALCSVRECQRLIEDLEERETLIAYAQKNGLTLLTGTTDELISVCRTHQEKIAEKNRLVDSNHTDEKTERRNSSFKVPPLPHEPAPVHEEFSLLKKQNNSNNNYHFSQTDWRSRRNQPSYNSSRKDRRNSSMKGSRNRSSYNHSQESSYGSRSDSRKRYSGYEYDDEHCDCDECRQQQSHYYEQLRKKDGYTTAGAQSARRGNSSQRFFNDNGWVKFTN